MIEITDLQKILDQGKVIDIPSFEVKAGQVAALFGPVDSGKDILFQLLIGELHPTKGSVRLAGVDPYHARDAFSHQVGVMFLDDNLYKRFSVLGNLQFYCRLWRLPKTRAVEVLEQVGLADHASFNKEKLSSGLSRRLALGRAILNAPRVLLLAEPFAGCEQASVKLISQVVRKMAEIGTAVLIFSQDIANLENLCDIIYRMDQGQIIESFDPQEQQQHQQPFMVPARGDEKIILIDPADILYAFAKDDRAYLQTSEGHMPTQFTLAELEKRLSRSGIFRAHRAYLVNMQQVKEVIPYTRDSFSLRLKDAAGTKIPLSKSAERELREL
ncbi:MAG: LytTR family transcriptional regulator DNA-binding domain-containing protein, partial [Anaerolineaceae bacterium]|nr:LytTR family transcriptional regulator DNA-binding domain-containing protein [Anaerolineaceae bacterium]